MTLQADLDMHTVNVFSSRLAAWAVCKCGWESGNFATPGIAQAMWAEHLQGIVQTDADDDDIAG